MLDETLADFDLSVGEWKAITHLQLDGPPHRKSPGQLARWAELSSGAMTNRLDRLEEAGLVRRVPDPDDRRGVLVELTDAGPGRLGAVGQRAGREGVADRGRA